MCVTEGWGFPFGSFVTPRLSLAPLSTSTSIHDHESIKTVLDALRIVSEMTGMLRDSGLSSVNARVTQAH